MSKSMKFAKRRQTRAGAARPMIGFARAYMVSRVIVGAGDSRRVADLLPYKAARIEAGAQIKRFLFPDDGSFHKAKRRGDKAMAMISLACRRVFTPCLRA